MSWRDRLRKATYKGVPFFYEGVTSTIGRRTQVTDLPGRDVPHAEDKGRTTRRFRVTAYVLGPDYDVDRDRMVRAIEGERQGAGLLVHPYWGNRQVRVVGDVPVHETTREGGMARFEITFVDVTEEGLPVRRRDAQAELDSASDKVLSAVREAFEDVFSIAEAVQDIRDQAEAAVETVSEAIGEVKAVIEQAVGIVGEGQKLINDLAAEARILIALPGQLAEQIVGAVESVIGTVTGLVDGAERAINSLTAPFKSGSVSDRHRATVLMRAWRELHAIEDSLPVVVETSGQQALRAANQAALVHFVRVVAVTETCRVAGEITFDSFDQAAAVRDELATAIDELLHEADDDTFSRLMDLRATLHRRVTDSAETLPRIVEVEVTSPTPALVLAHRIYGDATRDAEIINRNNIRNPAIIPAGTTLKVLSA